MSTLQIIAWILVIPVGLGALYWGMYLLRMRRALRSQPTVRAGLELPEPEGGWPRLSIVVPAHNEELVIDDCLTSLRAQDYPDLQLIFVLDRCTDGTLERVRRHADEDDRVVIIEKDSCPEDWAGKCHAAQTGAERAGGELLLFTDADTEFEPGLARASVALLLHRDVHLLSILSTLSSGRYHELVAQPVAAMRLAHMYPLDRINSARNRRPMANGQFILFRRDWYWRIGAHEATKNELCEDLALARLSDSHNDRALVVLADGMLRCRMYESLAEFASGWRRIFTDACKRKPGRLRKNGLRSFTAGLFLPLLQLAAIGVAVAAALNGSVPASGLLAGLVFATWLMQAVALTTIYPLAGAPRWTAVTYPLGCWIVGRILFQAARDLERRKPVVWGGRRYILEPR